MKSGEAYDDRVRITLLRRTDCVNDAHRRRQRAQEA
jgi:hypothetical protein